MTTTVGSDVVQSGRPIFDDFFLHLWPYIGNNTANVVLPNGQAFVAYPHRPMTLHSPTENSLAVLNHKILEANSQLLDIMIVQFRNEKVSNHGSIPITFDCNVVAFIVFEEVFHQPIKRTKQSVFLDVTVFRHTLVDSTPNAAALFVDVAIQPEVRNGNVVLGPFDESMPCLMVVLMNCQTKLRINHLTAVKSVAILESNANLNFYT
ncbi:alpha-2 adrenergic receptor [Trichonephila clavipes]|nr:alpha-2 adrenergic receptor [Trichonephila clavipes]